MDKFIEGKRARTAPYIFALLYQGMSFYPDPFWTKLGITRRALG